MTAAVLSFFLCLSFFPFGKVPESDPMGLLELREEKPTYEYRGFNLPLPGEMYDDEQWRPWKPGEFDEIISRIGSPPESSR